MAEHRKADAHVLENFTGLPAAVQQLLRGHGTAAFAIQKQIAAPLEVYARKTEPVQILPAAAGAAECLQLIFERGNFAAVCPVHGVIDTGLLLNVQAPGLELQPLAQQGRLFAESRARLPELIEQPVQLVNVILPQNIAVPDGGRAQPRVPPEQDGPVLDRAKFARLQRPRALGAVVDGSVFVRDLRGETRDGEQLRVVGIGGDQAEVDAALREQNEDETHPVRHGAERIVEEALQMQDAQHGIHNAEADHEEGERRVAAVFDGSRLGRNRQNAGHGADEDPHRRDPEEKTVVVDGIAGGEPLRKAEDQPVQVVRQKEGDQQGGRKQQQPRSSGRRRVAGQAQTERREQKRHGQQQKGNVVAVPEQAAELRPRLGEVVFERAEQHPQQQQHRGEKQIAPDRDLYQPLADGDAPGKIQAEKEVFPEEAAERALYTAEAEQEQEQKQQQDERLLFPEQPGCPLHAIASRQDGTICILTSFFSCFKTKNQFPAENAAGPEDGQRRKTADACPEKRLFGRDPVTNVLFFRFPHNGHRIDYDYSIQSERYGRGMQSEL